MGAANFIIIIACEKNAEQLKVDLDSLGYSSSFIFNTLDEFLKSNTSISPRLIIHEFDGRDQRTVIKATEQIHNKLDQNIPILYFITDPKANAVKYIEPINTSNYITTSYTISELELCINILESQKKEEEPKEILQDQ